MSLKTYIAIYGLNEDEDLIIEGRCVDCEALLWRDRYERNVEYVQLAVEQLETLTDPHAREEIEQAVRHECQQPSTS